MSAGEADAGLGRHLPDLLKAAGVTRVEVDVLTRSTSFSGSSLSERAAQITGPARDEHRRRGFGFWEYVLSASIEVDRETRLGLMRAALRHLSDEAIRMVLGIDDFIDHLRAGDFYELPARSLISLYSPVQTRAQTTRTCERWHLPLLDLGVPVGENGEAAAIDAMMTLGVEGLLFDSGRSYHFYGAAPMRGDELPRFLARAQLLSPLVDTRWVSHQLMDGRCGLRISTDVEKPQGHRLVARIAKSGIGR